MTSRTSGTATNILIIQPEEVDSWLCWAGERLLCMPLPNPGPAKQKICWPDTANDACVAYGYSDIKLKPISPAKDEIKFIDEILELILLVPDPRIRRILQARSLVAPISGKHLYSWSRLAKLLSSDRRKVASTHNSGLLIIARLIEPAKAVRIAEFLSDRYVA